MTRSNAPAICEGIGTMKRLTTLNRISSSMMSTHRISVPKPRIGGSHRSSVRAVMACRRGSLVVAHAAAGFFAQIAPDLRDVAPESLARHDLDERGRVSSIGTIRFTWPGR